MHYGDVGLLMQWSEFIIIGGAAIGAFLVVSDDRGDREHQKRPRSAQT